MIVGAEGEEAEVIAEKDEGVLVLEEQREALKERALVRFLDMLLERALGLGELEDGIERAQELELGALVLLLALEQSQYGAEARLDHGQAARGHERTQRRASNDHELKGLEQHDEVAAVQQIAAEHSNQDDG